MAAMKSAFAAVLAAFFLAFAGAGAAKVTPVEKVLELLQGMLSKAKDAKKAEAVQWTAYKQFCTDAEKGKQERVKAADIKIESLEADIQMFDAEVARLGEEIEGHEADIVAYNASLHNATAERKREREDYAALHQDYSESVTAVAKAIEVLKKQDYDRPQAAALLQRVAASAPPASRRAIQSFLEEPGEMHGYEFQSGGIVEMLKELSDKFVAKRTELEKEELEKAHAYEMLAHDYQAQIAAAKHEIAKKSESSAKAHQASVDAASQLKDLSATRADDVQFLDELHTTCNQKSADFESREKLRGDEIEALAKAIEIISSDSVKGAAERNLPTLLASGSNVTKARKALVQTHSLRKTSIQEQCAEFLQGASKRVGSHVLLALSMKVRDDPFSKVKKMIQDLISRLEEEAQAEADHKKWCDDELSTNEQTRSTKTTEVEGLHQTIGELEARVAVLKRTIAELSSAIADLQASMSKEEQLREKEREANQDTIAEAVNAQTAVQQAITVLQDFYSSAADATALVQGHAHAQAPPIFQKAYKGQQKEGDNVIAFLQVIQSDFARLESEVSGAEEEAQSEHDAFMTKAGDDLTQKNKDKSDAEKELQQKELDLATAKSDLELAQSELDTALAYYEKLKPSCLATSTESSWEERVKRREEEIQTLKEALSILSGETIVAGPQSLYSSVNGGNVGLDIGVTAN